MKLILKIAAGIIIAWITIIVSGLIIATLTATALSQAVVKPKMDELNKITNTAFQSNQGPVIRYSNKLPYTNNFDCVNNNGKWGYNA